jgi:5'-3' exonuclease
MTKNERQTSTENRASLRSPITPRRQPAEHPMPLVIFDVSYLAHRAKWTTSPLQFNGKPTGVLYGVLNQINRIRRLFPSNAALFFAWDSVFSLRREECPEYKAIREKVVTPEEFKMKKEFFQQMSLLRPRVLEPLGFRYHIEKRGFEADDGIASIVEWGHQNPKIGKIWIVSSDNDLFQLLDRATMYRPNHNRNYTMMDLFNEYGLSPKEWIMATAIAGTHNGLSGAYGVGLKTATAYVTGQSVSPFKMRSIKAAQRDGIIARNLCLIRLPYKGTRLVPYGIKPEPFRLDEEGLEEVCEEFGFNLRVEEWS